MICPHDNKSECQGPIDGSRWWNCPVHGVRLTEAWTKLCRNDLAYYNKWKGVPQKSLAERRTPQKGPGTELLAILRRPVKWIGWLYAASPKNCGGGCPRYAAQMDAWGVDGCRDRIKDIVDHLESQAAGQKLLFSRRAALFLVRWAIRRAEQAARRDGSVE